MNKNGMGTTMDDTIGNGHDSKLDAIKERARGVLDQSHEKVDQIKARAMDVKDQAVTRGNALVDQASDFIRANPLKSVGIAFGIGYVGMRLFR